MLKKLQQLSDHLSKVEPTINEDMWILWSDLALYQVEVADHVIADPQADEHVKQGMLIVVEGFSVIMQLTGEDVGIVDIAKFAIIHRTIIDIFTRVAPKLNKGYYDHMKMVSLLDAFNKRKGDIRRVVDNFRSRN